MASGDTDAILARRERRAGGWNCGRTDALLSCGSRGDWRRLNLVGFDVDAGQRD